MLEWCNDRIAKNFDVGRQNPFQFSYVVLLRTWHKCFVADVSCLTDTSIWSTLWKNSTRSRARRCVRTALRAFPAFTLKLNSVLMVIAGGFGHVSEPRVWFCKGYLHSMGPRPPKQHHFHHDHARGIVCFPSASHCKGPVCPEGYFMYSDDEGFLGRSGAGTSRGEGAKTSPGGG
jgi:hypothetical protein